MQQAIITNYLQHQKIKGIAIINHKIWILQSILREVKEQIKVVIFIIQILHKEQTVVIITMITVCISGNLEEVK
jgi:hypothetical protein